MLRLLLRLRTLVVIQLRLGQLVICYLLRVQSKVALLQFLHTSDASFIKRLGRVKKIVGAILWIGGAVNNKLLVALSVIGSQQASATEATNRAIHQLLDYCATYPDN